MRTFLTASEYTSIKFEREIREAVVVEMVRASTNVACIRSMEHNNWNEQRKREREREHWPSQFNVEALSGMQRTQGLISTGGRREGAVGGSGDRCHCPSSPTLITSSHPHPLFRVPIAPLLCAPVPHIERSLPRRGPLPVRRETFWDLFVWERFCFVELLLHKNRKSLLRYRKPLELS